MLGLKTSPYLHRPLSPLKSLFFSASPPSLSFPYPHPQSFPSLSFSSSASASASASTPMDPTTTTTTTTTVEHVVLFKVRDATDPTKIDSMVSNLRSLTSLNIATYLTAAPILRPRSAAASALAFTHLLHSRYPSKPDLAAYSAHPDHLSVVKNYVLPICDDIMAVDWIANCDLPTPLPGSALRLTLAKPKEAAATADILAAIDGIKGSTAAERSEQLSSGENFSPARAKGYTVGFISVFKSVEELDALMEDKEVVEVQKEKVRPLVESVIVLDYVVPQPNSASL